MVPFDKKAPKWALFLMPRASTAWKGSEALWITVAGWATAAKQLWPYTVVVTTDRVSDPAAVRDYPLESPCSPLTNRQPPARIPFAKIVPALVVTLLKDVLQWRRSKRAYRNLPELPSDPPAFVWEQHDIFPGPGSRLATQHYGVPLITYVHAPQVWEAAKWGVRRPLWGRWIERYIEAPALRRANVVACVSEGVADKLVELGVASENILVSPMAVDPKVFDRKEAAHALRNEYDLVGKIVIGWVGSFRSFHGLEDLIEVFDQVHRELPQTILLLVGDGIERQKIEKLVATKQLLHAVRFTGRQKFSQVPSFISLFDIAIVSAKSAQGFHYSPLKLREYLAAGKATLAPRAGEIPTVFTHGENVLLYSIGNIAETARVMKELVVDEGKRDRLGNSGREFILDHGTWMVELRKVLDRLPAKTSA